MDTRWTRAATGALAGCLATIPMTAIMAAGHRQLPWWHRHPAPPKHITEAVLHTLGLRDELSGQERTAATVASHFGYGTAMGAAFGLLPKSSTAGCAVAAGTGYGLAVWAASYLGWLPATGMYRSPAREPWQRHAMMIAAHIVWGAAAGALSHAANATADKREA